MTAYPDYNIILVNLDGLRQDKVELCPNLNSLKEKGIYFSNMIYSYCPSFNNYRIISITTWN